MESSSSASQQAVGRGGQLEQPATSAVMIDEPARTVVDRLSAARQDAAVSRELGRRLRSVAREVDDLWRSSLQGQDFDLVWRSSEASLALHRAVLALEDGASIG